MLMKKSFYLLMLIVMIFTACNNTTNKQEWTIKHFKDKYGDIVEDAKYITTVKPIEGTFSNSITNNSKCSFEFVIFGDDTIGLIIYEYGINNSKMNFSYRIEYDCELKFNDGTTSVDFSAETQRFTDIDLDMIVFDNDWIKEVLLEKKDFKLYLKEVTKFGTPSTYLVSVEVNNFEKVYLEYDKY